MRHSTQQILAILDRCCDAFTFPMLDNGYVYLAATRLSLFRSPEDWAMVIEVFGFSPRSGLPDTCIHTFAGTVGRGAGATFVDQQAHDAYLANNPNNESHFVFPIEEGDWIDLESVAEGATELTLRGQVIPMPDHTAYQRAGVALQDPPRAQIFELCRVLAHEARDAVLATPDERRINVTEDLQLLLTLDEWAHPDVVDETKRPSGSATFQQLARVLVTGDLNEYRPKEAPNTHWSNWPEGGTL
jgi:uncharacterized protein DUF7003